MIYFGRVFTDVSSERADRMFLYSAPSAHTAGAVFLRVTDHKRDVSVSMHLTKADIQTLADGLREVSGSVPDTITYRGVNVPNGFHVNGRVDESFKTGVDAALNTTEGRGICGKTRESGHYPEYPCVLPHGHDEMHEDRDEDFFER